MATVLFGRKTKLTEAPDVPKYSGLAIPVECELDQKTQSEHDGYLADCCEFEKRVEALHASRGRLLDGALDQPLRATLNAAGKLNEDRAALEVELCQLRWRKFSLLPRLVPGFKQALADAGAEHNRIVGEVRADFESMGITARAMQAGEHNPPAAERQLEHRIRQEQPVLSAKAAVNGAQVALRVLESQLGNVPRSDSCAISWQGAPAGIGLEIACLVKLDGAAPTISAPLEFSEQGRRIVREVGLDQAALLPEHIATIRELDGALPAGTNWRPPLRHASGKVLQEVRRLLRELPATREVHNYLENTRTGCYVV